LTDSIAVFDGSFDSSYVNNSMLTFTFISTKPVPDNSELDYSGLPQLP